MQALLTNDCLNIVLNIVFLALNPEWINGKCSHLVVEIGYYISSIQNDSFWLLEDDFNHYRF